MADTRDGFGPKPQQDYSDLPQKPITLKNGIGGLAGPVSAKVDSTEHHQTASPKATPPKTPSVAKSHRATGQWTIRGISKTAREAATQAARDEGLKVSEWLERAIHQSLTPPAKSFEGEASVMQALDEIRSRLERIEQQNGFLYRIWQRIKTWLG